MGTIKIYLVAFLGMVVTTSCKNESKTVSTENKVVAVQNTAVEKTGQAFVTDDEGKPTALSIAIGSQDHTTLVAAVQAAQLENALVNAGPLMVFAPTNEAFSALPEGTLEHLLKPENQEALAN